MYRLWSFTCNGLTVITRGITRNQAYQYASRHWQKGQTISLDNSLPINAKNLYDQNHPFDWLNIAPKWVQLQETQIVGTICNCERCRSFRSR